MDHRPQWHRGGRLAVAISLILILFCVVVGAVFQSGRNSPPVLNLRLGRFHLVAFTAFASSCPSSLPVAPAAGRPVRGIYTVLLFTPIPEHPSSAIGHTLLELPLRC